MKAISKFLFLFLFAFCANQAQAGNSSGPTPEGNSDTSVSIKSNIVIFKMITGSQNSNNTATGTLKKAGKMARTSNSATSLKTPIVLPPKRNL